MRDRFTFFRSYYEAIEQLKEKEQLALYKAIMAYQFDGIELELNGITKAIFNLIKPVIDTNNARNSKYKSRQNVDAEDDEEAETNCRQNVSAIDTQSTDTKCQQNVSTVNVKVADTNCRQNVSTTVNSYKLKDIKEKDISKDISKKKSSFCPPSIQEIETYCKERNNRVDAKRFYDFYESKGWMIGKNKMKDWKAAVRTWEERDRAPGRDLAVNYDTSNNPKYNIDNLEELIKKGSLV